MVVDYFNKFQEIGNAPLLLSAFDVVNNAQNLLMRVIRSRFSAKILKWFPILKHICLLLAWLHQATLIILIIDVYAN